MSYILDALERSERERNQNELPSFRQDQSLLHMRRDRRSPWLVALTVVLLLNAVVFLYIHFSSTSPASSVEQDAIATLNTPAMQASERNLVSRDSVTALQPQVAKESEDAAVLTEPKLVQQSATIPEPLKVTSETLTDKSKTTASTDVGRSVEKVSTVALDRQQDLQKQSLYAIDVPAKQMANAVPTEPVSIEPVTSGEVIGEKLSPLVIVAEQPLDEPSTVVTDPYSDVLYLHEMDAGSRPRVPKLTFNSYIYSSEPSARRVMINNIYLREGQAFEGMTLLTIAEQFLVFEKSGTQFKIAAMRDWLG